MRDTIYSSLKVSSNPLSSSNTRFHNLSPIQIITMTKEHEVTEKAKDLVDVVEDTVATVATEVLLSAVAVEDTDEEV